ncbi:MAG: hypothetical protein ABIP44_10995 [Pseudoxanthomonas sp.]
MNGRLAVALLFSSSLLAGCGAPTAEPAAPAAQDSEAHVPVADDAPSWEIGEDIAGKKVVIDGKQVAVPDEYADAKRKMDAVAKEKLDAMDALEKQRMERFKDPDMTP